MATLCTGRHDLSDGEADADETEQVGTRFNNPVLYTEKVSKPQMRNLENIIHASVQGKFNADRTAIWDGKRRQNV